MVAPEVEATGATGATGAKPVPGARVHIPVQDRVAARQRGGGEAGEPTGARAHGRTGSWCCAGSSCTHAPSPRGRQTAKRRRASFAYTADDGDEMDLAEGDVLEDMQDLGGGWSQGRNARTGEVGTSIRVRSSRGGGGNHRRERAERFARNRWART